jgi:hypothetical protein
MLPALIAAWFFVFPACSQSQSILLTESFETGNGTIPPAGWEIEQISGSGPGISFVTSSANPVISAAADGAKFVSYNSAAIATGTTRLKRSNPISTTVRSCRRTVTRSRI